MMAPTSCKTFLTGANHAKVHRTIQAPKARAQEKGQQKVNSDNLGVYLTLRVIHV